ncbi:phosphotransferase [Escherichia coli]|uniref:phosphotransferase n=1 Tax=Escherichia coli TaxID=562 RepID=UPI0020187E45|nr:phosphotransferase [Escherichia coli]
MRCSHLSVDQCPFERRLSRMFDAPLMWCPAMPSIRLLPDEDKSTPQLDLLARVERELPVRLDQERTDMVVCHGDPCMPNFMWTLNSSMHGSDRLGRLGTADRYADLALMIANAEENWQRQMKQSAPSLSYQCIGDRSPDRERLAFYLRLTL